MLLRTLYRGVKNEFSDTIDEDSTLSTVDIKDFKASTPTLDAFKELVVLVGDSSSSPRIQGVKKMNLVEFQTLMLEEFETSLSDWTATLNVDNADAQRAAQKAYILYWPLVWPLFFKQSNELTPLAKPRPMSLSDNAENVNVFAIFHEWLLSTHAHVFIVMPSQDDEQSNKDRLQQLRGRKNIHVHVLNDLPNQYQALLSHEQPTHMTLRGEPSLF